MVDFSLEGSLPVVNRDISVILQQIDILFDTFPKEVLGYEEWGTKYEDYLHRLKISNDALRHEVLADINSLNLFGFVPQVEVILLEGTEQDIALVDITLTREMESYNRTYRIS